MALAARVMNDGAIAAEIASLNERWTQLRADLEESGGASGSPGEWIWERMGELEHEQQRRALAATTEGGRDG